MEEAGLKRWLAFFDTGIVPKRPIDARPDEFLIDESNIGFLEKSIRDRSENKDNWYAYYQLGIGFLVTNSFENAQKSFAKSQKCEKNAWSYHGAAVCSFKEGKIEAAVLYILNGIKLRKQDLSYLKESFKILNLCCAYREICKIYDELNNTLQVDGRLKYYYIYSSYKLGEIKKAFRLLNQNGGLKVDDMREGDEIISQMWEDLYKKIHGLDKKAPPEFMFKANL